VADAMLRELHGYASSTTKLLSYTPTSICPISVCEILNRATTVRGCPSAIMRMGVREGRQHRVHAGQLLGSKTFQVRKPRQMVLLQICRRGAVACSDQAAIANNDAIKVR